MILFLILFLLKQVNPIFIYDFAESKDVEVDLKSYSEKLIMVFQPDCGFCRKQVREFSCLDSLTQVQLWGSYASKENILKEYKRMRINYPLSYVPKRELQNYNLLGKGTPHLLYYQGGELKVSLIGFNSCSLIKGAIKSVKKN